MIAPRRALAKATGRGSGAADPTVTIETWGALTARRWPPARPWATSTRPAPRLSPAAPGTIDADYRGEVKVALINLGENDFVVEPGMRVCQMIVKEVPKCAWQEVDELSDTVRGAGGFGHTGH